MVEEAVEGPGVDGVEDDGAGSPSKNCIECLFDGEVVLGLRFVSFGGMPNVVLRGRANEGEGVNLGLSL